MRFNSITNHSSDAEVYACGDHKLDELAGPPTEFKLGRLSLDPFFFRAFAGEREIFAVVLQDESSSPRPRPAAGRCSVGLACRGIVRRLRGVRVFSPGLIRGDRIDSPVGESLDPAVFDRFLNCGKGAASEPELLSVTRIPSKRERSTLRRIRRRLL